MTIYIALAVACIGTWVAADGFASLWTYTNGERSKGQTFWRDHALRILRCILGLALIALGVMLV